jgi:hypothetical protein
MIPAHKHPPLYRHELSRTLFRRMAAVLFWSDDGLPER